jgi:hypothetical protein
MANGIAVRFYDNAKYGSTYGKGLYRNAVFNATADLRKPEAKYLLDMFSFNDWQNRAKTDLDMEALEAVADFRSEADRANLLATWIKRLDCDGTKKQVHGFGLFDLITHELTLLISDEEAGVVDSWLLDVKPCKQATGNKKSPQLLATNEELS